MTCGVDIFTNIWYLVARCVLWAGLCGITGLDFWRHRQDRVYGWQLFASVFVLVCFTVLQSVVSIMYNLFIYSQGFCLALIFFDNLVFSAFIGLLMLISYGWKITHDSLGDGAISVKVAPVLFFVSSIIHDFIIQIETKGTGYLDINQMGPVESNFLMFSSLFYIFTVVYMLFWIFETIQMEKTILEEKIVATLNNNEEQTGGSSNNNGNNNAGGGGGAVTEMKDFDDIEREESDSDDDNQYIPNTAKLTLLTRFFYAVTNYFLAICLLKIFVIFNFGIMSTAVLIYHDVVFFAFVAVLAYLFRLREHSPYFLVADDGKQVDILHTINVDTMDSDNDDGFLNDSDTDGTGIPMREFDNGSVASGQLAFANDDNSIDNDVMYLHQQL